MNSPLDSKLGSKQKVVENCGRFLAETITEHPLDLSGLRRLEGTLATRRLPLRRQHIWAWAIGGTLAAFCLMTFLFLHDTPPLTYVILNGTGSTEGHVRASDNGEAKISFSDGSQVLLTAGTRGWVSELTTRGAKILMDSGKLHADFMNHKHGQWSIGAGPFTVLVTGTSFDLKWSSQDQILDVRMHRGSVIVEGPITNRRIPLHQGQRLVFHGQKGQLLLSDDPYADEVPSDPSQTVDSATNDNGHTPHSTVIPSPAIPPLVKSPFPPSNPRPEQNKKDLPRTKQQPSWSRKVAAGDFLSVLNEAHQRGLDTVMAQGSLDEVAALADAARYTRKQDIARRSLEALIARFTHTSDGKNAVFFLGGLADSEADWNQALLWYDRYLSESPEGSYVEQAIGRKMILQDTHKLPIARVTAQLYLERYPNGSYANPARKILK